MSLYKTVLFTTDFAEDAPEKALKALQIATAMNATLHILHIVASMPEYSIGYIMSPDVEQRMIDEARGALATMGEQIDVPLSRQYVDVGSPKNLVLAKAAQMKVDLIMVGSHGHHGWGLLLGSTAGSIMHNADCDVLVIKTATKD